jgi:fatty-acyl-CoA synthase
VDASAVSVPGPDQEEIAVLIVQCNITDSAEQQILTQRLHREIHEELGVNCVIELVPRHTLPRTSSGKLSRSGARKDYILRQKALAENAAK